MAQAFALAAIPLRISVQEWVRLVIVCGCALALICAERALPTL